MAILPMERFGRESFAECFALWPFASRHRSGPGPGSLLAPSPLTLLDLLLVRVTTGLWYIGHSECWKGLPTEQSSVISQFKL